MMNFAGDEDRSPEFLLLECKALLFILMGKGNRKKFGVKKERKGKEVQSLLIKKEEEEEEEQRSLLKSLVFLCVQFDLNVCHSVEETKEKSLRSHFSLVVLFERKVDIHLNSSLLINEIINHISLRSHFYPGKSA